jgi:hypothetical protein
VANEIRWVGGEPGRDRPAADVASVDAELAELHHMGVSIGLSREQVNEVIDAWTEWWGVGPQTHLDFGIISSSLAACALQQPWKPGEMTDA